MNRPMAPAGTPAADAGAAPAGNGQPWVCLIVDDEPAIHDITRLVLANTRFDGRAIEFHSAYSASEAKTFLQDRPDTALVLLDVVMETDDAGLGLVRHIRDTLEYADLQIVLRTGQPGMAPERDVILNFDINGYYLKTEITAQKLYSLVIAALRTYKSIRAIRRSASRLDAHPPPTVRSARRRGFQEELVRMVDDGRCHFVALPEIDLASDRIVGVELLPNWRTEAGILGFTQVAEVLQAEDLRLALDRNVLRYLRGWVESWKSSAANPIRVSIPVLGDWIGDCAMFDAIEEYLDAYGTTPGTLDLEVTEEALVRKLPTARAVIERLQTQGISVTMTNFGAGMISLPLLYRLQPSRIKIHRSYVTNVAGEPEKAAIVRSVIALGHTLGLGIVADGIGDELDFEFVKWEGFDVGQGDLLARSIALADVAKFLEARCSAVH